MTVLDTSAVMAVLEQEAEADRVIAILERSSSPERPVHLAFVTLMEVEYKLLRRFGREKAHSALSLVEAWPVRVVESNLQWRRIAAAIKAVGGLSLADAWVAALAVLLDTELVHKDAEFDRVAGLRSLHL